MKQNQTILLVDDEVKVTEVLQAYLEKAGYSVLAAHDGKTALEHVLNQELSLIVLDLMLPDIMGEDVCRRVRAQSRVPIIMLTAKADEPALVQGLAVGADDYLTKPFSPRTVLAKVEAVLRRTCSDELASIPIAYGEGDLVIDFIAGSVRKAGKPVALTPTEYKLLTTMAKAPGRTFTRNQLISYALDDAFDGYDRSIDTYIKSLRLKVETDRRRPQYVQTVHGMGYRFTAGSAKSAP